MKSTPLYLAIDVHRELEIVLRVREYNGIDSDPKVIVREPTFSEAMSLARHLPEPIFRSITATPDLDYPEANAAPASESEAHFILRALDCFMKGEPAWESAWMNHPNRPAKTPADVVKAYLAENP